MRFALRIARDLRLFGATLALGAMLLYVLAYWPLRDVEPVRILLASIASTLVTILTIRIFYEWFASTRLFDSYRILVAAQEYGLVDITNFDDIRWTDYVRSSRQTVLVGNALGVLQGKSFQDALMDNVAKGASVTLVLSDPRSHAASDRLEDEPQNDPEVYLDGMAKRVEKIWELKQSLRSRQQSKFRICLTSRYPTIAVFAFDQHFFLYFYGYKMRGIWSPVLHFQGQTSKGAVFLAHHTSALMASPDTHEVTPDLMDELRSWASGNTSR